VDKKKKSQCSRMGWNLHTSITGLAVATRPISLVTCHSS
jgi:hypothetical protein